MQRTCSIGDCARTVRARGYCSKHYQRVMSHGDPNYFAYDRTPSERFWAKVDTSGDCWEWRGYVHKNGYGQFGFSPARGVMAHRFAYEDRVGAIPQGMQIDHTCYNRGCVNPAHLRTATSKQNVENQSGVRSDNRHGFRGVGFNKKTGKYRARVWHRGHDHYAGEFCTPEEAAESAKQLRLKLFTHNDMDRTGQSDQANAARRIAP